MSGRVGLESVAVAIALTVGVGFPSVAQGAEWPWPVRGQMVLPYAATWTDISGRTCSHGGVDIAAGTGASVEACAGGRVAFAGRVPAAGGGTVLAVSVETPDGERVTYMPLADIAVASGAALAPGDAIGTLAAAGDASSAGPHLHLSVRRGEAPIDPLTLLGPPSTAAPAASPPVPAPAPSRATPAKPPSPRPAPAAAPVHASAAAPAAASPAPASTTANARLPHAPVELGPRADVRIRPLPTAWRLDPRAVYQQAARLASSGRGMAARLLLGALAVLLLGRALRAAAREGGSAVQAIPQPAHSWRPRG